MHTGMLWPNDVRKDFDSNLKMAFDFYKGRFGNTPTLCMVHPTEITKELSAASVNEKEVIVKAYRPVLPGYIWIGLGDPKEMAQYRAELNPET